MKTTNAPRAKSWVRPIYKVVMNSTAFIGLIAIIFFAITLTSYTFNRWAFYQATNHGWHATMSFFASRMTHSARGDHNHLYDAVEAIRNCSYVMNGQALLLAEECYKTHSTRKTGTQYIKCLIENNQYKDALVIVQELMRKPRSTFEISDETLQQWKDDFTKNLRE